VDTAAEPRAKRMASLKVGIAGAGASTVCLLQALTQIDGPIGRIAIFDPGDPWCGRNYQDDFPAVKVNALPDEMSVRPGDPGHLRRWLPRGAPDVPLDPCTGTPFIPRGRYGEYLRESVSVAIDTLRRRGWHVRVDRTSVVAATRTHEQVVLQTDSGRHHAVDYAVLCLGGDRPHQPYPLVDVPGYVPDPYPIRQSLRDMPHGADITILGSGLSAVDVVLALAARQHGGRITLASRSGVLPAVRQRPAKVELRHVTRNRLRLWTAQGRNVTFDRFVCLVMQEMQDGGHDTKALADELLRLETEDPVHRLRRHLSAVNEADLGLRILQRAVPDCGPDVWPLLPETERAMVLERHYRAVMSLCCPMPPSTAAVLLQLADSGQLKIRSRVASMRPAGGGRFEFPTAKPWTSDIVVNATGPPAHRIPRTARALVDSLVCGGWAQRHPHGGLHVERATSRLTVHGVSDPRLYAVGDLAFGSLFFTFGIPVLVDRAVDVAGAILEHAESGRRIMPTALITG
jgi:uncharacterized NAD(P)/FAD-binding protein YdhS